MPFNHSVLSTWLPNQSDWDAEPPSQYRDPLKPPLFMAAHMALIPVGTQRGRVLVWNYMRINQQPVGSVRDKQHWAIVNVGTGGATFQNFDLGVTTTIGDPFCAGTAWTSQGLLLIAGGNQWNPGLGASKLCWLFDPNQSVGNLMWVQGPNLHFSRWYPNVTAMPDGTLHVTGGTDAVPSVNAQKTFEVFSPATGAFVPNENKLPAKPPYFDGPPVACSEEFGVYPRELVLSSGKKFTAGMMDQSYRVLFQNTSGNPPLWEVMNVTPVWGKEWGSIVLFPNLGGPGGPNQDLVMRLCGRRTYPSAPPLCRPGLDVTNVVEACAANATTGWFWAPITPLAFARANQNATLLPDGTVLVTGGKTNTDDEFLTTNPVLQTESFNGQAWTTLASATVRRGYHSTAILLPDGRVLVGGGEEREMDYEVFSPPYLTAPQGQRPVIVNAPSTLVMLTGSATEYSLQYQPLPLGEYIAKVVLMAPGAVTHHFDMHQRYVELVLGSTVPIEGAPPSRSFKAPPTANHALPGYYMLFFVSNKGVPSVATWVQLQ